MFQTQRKQANSLRVYVVIGRIKKATRLGGRYCFAISSGDQRDLFTDKFEKRRRSWAAKKRVGSRIKAIRKQKDLIQGQFAERMGRSVDAISNLERGVSHPSFETLERLSETLEVPVKAFFEFKGVVDISAKRAALLEELSTVAAQFKDKELEIGVKQLQALVK